MCIRHTILLYCSQYHFSLESHTHETQKTHNVEISAGLDFAGCPFGRTSQRKSSGCQRTAPGSPANFEGCNSASYCSSSQWELQFLALQHTGHSGILVTNEVETLIVQALLFEFMQVLGPFHAYFEQKSIHII